MLCARLVVDLAAKNLRCALAPMKKGNHSRTKRMRLHAHTGKVSTRKLLTPAQSTTTASAGDCSKSVHFRSWHVQMQCF
eukprot:4004257-Amphidinium_carterae.1